MSVKTIHGNIELDNEIVASYFHALINQFFKILPMRENNESTLNVYMDSLMFELQGCKSLITEFGNNPMFISLLAVLQGLIDGAESYSVTKVRREVFHAISICNKLTDFYTTAIAEGKYECSE